MLIVKTFRKKIKHHVCLILDEVFQNSHSFKSIRKHFVKFHGILKKTRSLTYASNSSGYILQKTTNFSQKSVRKYSLKTRLSILSPLENILMFDSWLVQKMS